MTVFPTFEEVYPRMEKELEKAKAYRSKQKGKVLRNFVIGIVLWLAVIVSVLLRASSNVTGTILFIVFLASCVLIGLTIRSIREFHYEYKKSVVRTTLDAMFQMIEAPEDADAYKYYVRYYPTKYILDTGIDRSDIISSYTHSEGEDLTSGQIGLTTFEFSEVKYWHEEEVTDDQGKKEVKKHTVFKGVVFVADFHKDFEGRTYLYNSRLTRADKMRLKRKDAYQIELEDPVFNKAFKTLTTEDIEARYILSANLMERMVTFKNRAHGPVRMVFADSKMYILTETNKNLFESQFWRSNDEKALRQIYEEFMTYFEIIEEFTLNRRIWRKQ